jgi:hypothetical protein
MWGRATGVGGIFSVFCRRFVRLSPLGRGSNRHEQAIRGKADHDKLWTIFAVFYTALAGSNLYVFIPTSYVTATPAGSGQATQLPRLQWRRSQVHTWARLGNGRYIFQIEKGVPALVARKQD